MKKSLLALAVASAFAAPAAFADVTISGAINMGPVWGSSGNGTATTTSNSITSGTASVGFSNTGLTSNYSNMNISSSDDIGGGNKVVMNYQFDFSNTGSTLHEPGVPISSRNSYLGITGTWGGVYWGINEQIYERYMYTSDVLDGAVGIGGNLQMLGTPGYGRVFENGNSGCGPSSGCVDFYRRSGQSIWFDSADYSGFSFGVVVGLSAYKTAGGPNPTHFSAGVQYKPADGPFYVNAAFERHSDFFGLQVIDGPTGATGSTDTGIQVGGGVNLGDVGLNLRFERLTYKSDGLTGTALNEYERSAIWFGAKLNLASGYAGLQIGMADDADCSLANGAACNANDTGATMVSGGYFHNLSKQSQLQFIASFTSNDALANYVNIGTPGGSVGADGKSLAVLLKHVF
ncbi:MAG: porin [Burkholderiales bacterium]